MFALLGELAREVPTLLVQTGPAPKVLGVLGPRGDNKLLSGRL